MSRHNFGVLVFISLVAGMPLLSHSQASLPAGYGGGVKINHVRVWEARAPQNSPDSFSVATRVQSARMTTEFIDGLGRPVQTVIKQGSMITGDSARDLVSPVVYDEFGRVQLNYLPFGATTTGGNASLRDGAFKLNPFQQQSAFMTSQFGSQGETFFYNQTVFEASPLNRVTENFAPGNSWAGTAGQSTEALRRSVKAKYRVNTIADSVRIWKVADMSGAFGNYTTAIGYAAGELYKNATVDEHGKQVVEFKDKEGLVILKKVQLTSGADTGTGRGYDGWLCTYYLYDSLNRLRCVIQPEGVKALATGSWTLTTTLLNEQCFRYEYDDRGRMITKKVPGAGEVYMVYDVRNRLVMMQDANLRIVNKWMVTKYDMLDRPTETGLWISATAVTSHRSSANVSGAYPSTGSDYEKLTVTHYDDYADIPDGWTGSFDNSWSSHFESSYNTAPLYAQGQAASAMTKGMVTWTQTKLLGSSNTFFSAVNIYDDKGRVIQVKATNVLGTDIITTQYNWAGQPLVTVQSQSITGTNAQTSVVVTKVSYDELGRVAKTEKKLSHTKVDNNEMSGYTTVSEVQYDALGQLKTKAIGSKKDPATNEYLVPREPLEILNYDYNIRGWLLGMNRGFIRDEGTAKFGFELAYDKRASIHDNFVANTYTQAQYNGNIGGMIWKSIGDGEKRKYDFEYDAANRIVKAGFTQYTGGWNTSAGIDYSIGGDNTTGGTMKYDANGNILEMWQKGLKLNSSDWVDKLSYTYFTGSNRLQSVSDAMATDNKLGDFTDKNTTATDYGYDANGNLVTDLNKRINGTTGTDVSSGGNINYNHLNLVQSVTVKDESGSNKGKVSYSYDAAGVKVARRVQEYPNTANSNTSTNTLTYYANGFVYETKTDDNANTADYTNKLQFLGMEEGRIRYRDSTDATHPAGIEYDYMIKDHLGNVRMVLTEEQRTDAYPAATMEPGDAGRDTLLYSNINETRSDLPEDYPADNSYSDPNEKVAKVSGSGNKIGPAIVLKVMAGDQFSLRVSSWYKKNGATPNTPNSPLTSLIAALTGSIGGIAAGHGSSTDLQANNTLDPGALSFYNSHSTSDSTTKPKAFINWVLFDEQFRYVSSNSGFEQVGADNTLTVHTRTGLPINKNGYLYIYTSNETPNIDVFFDNLQVTHIRGPVLEETHYYPFGLTMQAISLKALSFGCPESKIKFQGQEFANNEFSDGAGLDMYEFKYRMDDPQIGRFWQVDPKADDYRYNSCYAFSENRVIDGRELEGLEYVSIHHYSNGIDGKKMHYKSTDKEINKINGTTSGPYNSASYGPLGPGVIHYYYNKDGAIDPAKTRWDQQQTGLESDMAYHGLYSGPGSVTDRNGNYDFTFQPIDWADAIAKRHDMDYHDIQKNDKPGDVAGVMFLEDVRTVQADRDMVQRISDYNSIFRDVKGVEKPYRTSTSIEMELSMVGQEAAIGALAIYKQWKIDNGYGNQDTYDTLRDQFRKDNKAKAYIIDKLIGR